MKKMNLIIILLMANFGLVLLASTNNPKPKQFDMSRADLLVAQQPSHSTTTAGQSPERGSLKRIKAQQSQSKIKSTSQLKQTAAQAAKKKQDKIDALFKSIATIINRRAQGIQHSLDNNDKVHRQRVEKVHFKQAVEPTDISGLVEATIYNAKDELKLEMSRFPNVAPNLRVEAILIRGTSTNYTSNQIELAMRAYRAAATQLWESQPSLISCAGATCLACTCCCCLTCFFKNDIVKLLL